MSPLNATSGLIVEEGERDYAAPHECRSTAGSRAARRLVRGLPRSRVEAAAEAHQVGAPDTAREIVRRVAPAAARRISRAVLTDRGMREQADRFLAVYEARLNEAVRRDPEGFMTMALLASEPGRAFLLIDAAIGDLG